MNSLCIHKFALSLSLLVAALLSTIPATAKRTEQRTPNEQQLQYTEKNAALIIISYPDMLVHNTEAAYHNLIRVVGVGGKKRTRAGHASFVIAKKNTPTFEHYDNGRYIAPVGYSRVRSAETDIEMLVDLEAKWEDGVLTNHKELLQWLYNNPDKTLSSGDIYATINYNVSYERVKDYIKEMLEEETMPYCPFLKDGTNCARFVSDAMSIGIIDDEVQQQISRIYRITPSGLSSVRSGTTDDNYYRVTPDSIYLTTENLKKTQRKLLFDWGRNYPNYNNVGTIVEPTDVERPDSWQWLAGISHGVWFEIIPTDCAQHFRINQYDKTGSQLFSAIFASEDDLELPRNYQVTYPSHYGHVTIALDDEQTIRLTRIPSMD